MTDLDLSQLHVALSSDLERIARRFKPGTRLTLVVRTKLDNPEGDIVIGDDNFDDAIAAIQRRKAETAPERCFGPAEPESTSG